jgi:transaldolase
MTNRAEASADAGLRLFLDTADRAAWERWLPTGLFYGVTTNPALLERAGLKCRLPVLADLVRDALRHGIAEAQVQTWGVQTEWLIENGLALAAIDRRVVVKVPATLAGVRAATALHRSGARTTLTAVYAAHQALIGAAIGCDYAAPYFGRIGDAGRDAMAEIKAMTAIISASARPIRLLVASIRTPDELAMLAAVGVNTFTIGPAVAEALFDVQATSGAAAEFEAAAAR